MDSKPYWNFLKLRELNRIHINGLLKKMSHKSGGIGAKSKGDNSTSGTLDCVKGTKPKIGKKCLSPEEVLLCSYLEKLRLYLQDDDDHTEQIRNLANKVLSFLKVSEISNKAAEGLPLFISILKSVDDAETIKYIVQIIELYLVPKQGLKNCSSILLDNDIVGALLHSVHVAKLSSNRDTILFDIFALLAKFTLKDSDFVAKLRRSGVLKSIVQLMKKNSNKLILLRPLLLLLKAIAAGCTSSSFLGRQGVCPICLSLINSLGIHQSTSLKLVIEIVVQLTKSKYNCREIVNQSGVSSIFNQLSQWEKVEGYHKFKILRGLLVCLSNLASYKVGYTAIIDADGLGFLYRFCKSLPLIVEYERIISQASNVLQKCLPRKWLPIDNTVSAVIFPLPGSNLASNKMRNKCGGTTVQLEEEDSDDDDDDEDEDDSSSCSEDDSEMYNYMDLKYKIQAAVKEISVEDLSDYQKFMPELDFGIISENRLTEKDNNYLRRSNDSCPKTFERDHALPASSPLPSCDDLHGILSCFSLSKRDSKDSGGFSDNNLLADNKWKTVSNECVDSVSSGNLRLDCKRPIVVEQKTTDNNLKKFKFSDTYISNAKLTKSVAPFVKVAHPDINATDTYYRTLEPLCQRDPAVCRRMLLHTLDRLFGGVTHGRVVYDYDALVADDNMMNFEDGLVNVDHLRLGKSEESVGHLKFESRFESGNLRKAIMIGAYEYELILNPDVNSDHHHQWFYFEISNMEAGVPYSFYISNCEKSNSQFNFGMKPLLYSVREATLGRPYWIRSGTNICYFCNHYSCPPGAKNSNYFTTYFSITFQHPKDVCYVAYHYPYTYTLLRTHLQKWTDVHDKGSVFYRQHVLCNTLSGNEVPIITITSANLTAIDKRPIIFLTSRVHPGETNSSWVMKGTIDFLLSDKPSAESLRETFVFKIIPMLNPDGVINGCHRCSLSAEDLNRCWLEPLPSLHPTIFHSKRFLLYLRKCNKLPLVYCDYHGHSRQKNVFFYGCNNNLSWLQEDRMKPFNNDFELLPKVLHHLAPAFTLNNCCFTIEKNRESTARVTVWRQLGVKLSFTMESTYCGCDQGPYKDYHLGIQQYEEMGMKFVVGILHVHAKLKSVENSFSKEFLKMFSAESLIQPEPKESLEDELG